MILRTGLHGHSGPGVISVTQMVSGAMGFQPADVPKTESDALIALYNATNGPGWTNNTNWLIDTTVGNWFGVTVAGGHVTQLGLNTNNLVGSVATWSPDDLPSLTHLYLYSTSVSGDISGWVLPNSLVQLYLYDTSVSGDISGWVLPNSLVRLYLNSTSVSGDIGAWVLPNSMVRLYLHSTNLSGAPDISSNTAMRDYRYDNCGLSQANVDAVLLSVYNRRMAFTYATPALNVGGTNAAPSGIYQAACPPGTGKEYAFELVNDSCGDGFNKWTVTFTP